MKKSSFQKSLDNFYINMGGDITFLMKIEEAKMVVKSIDEKRAVFEAFVFRICANWEILVGDLLIDCLNKDTSQYKEFTGFGISKHLPRETCKAMILGVTYVDFKSVSELKKMAKRILVPQFNPFQKIPRSNGDKIDEFFTLRNYLAHYSDAAERSLDRMYKNRHGLRSFREPGDFLLALDKTRGMIRMAVYIENFLETADIMGEFCNVDILTS